eukprot:TRINITY_DN11928_c0_g1_i1.p1 TRINITY_DN11928_c0_g1~~TRINITY_DN11928_c0_g1_i1.p1  ORF type:complete len:103 (+),score=4.54 TRINITY_DN11928_c0_g1_i1:178-486(+)
MCIRDRYRGLLEAAGFRKRRQSCHILDDDREGLFSMDKKELDLILKHFGAEKEFIGDGYFRIREKDSNRYEMAYLAPACCGTSTYHPQICLLYTSPSPRDQA